MQTQGHGAPNWRQSLFWFQFLHEVQADGRSSPPYFLTLIRELFAVKQNLTCISYSNVAWKQRDPIPTTEKNNKNNKGDNFTNSISPQHSLCESVSWSAIQNYLLSLKNAV